MVSLDDDGGPDYSDYNAEMSTRRRKEQNDSVLNY